MLATSYPLYPVVAHLEASECVSSSFGAAKRYGATNVSSSTKHQPLHSIFRFGYKARSISSESASKIQPDTSPLFSAIQLAKSIHKSHSSAMGVSAMWYLMYTLCVCVCLCVCHALRGMTTIGQHQEPLRTRTQPCPWGLEHWSWLLALTLRRSVEPEQRVCFAHLARPFGMWWGELM